eukprot:1621497-Rhodomonas_salina.1
MTSPVSQGASGQARTVGRSMAKGLAQCGPSALAYGTCCGRLKQKIAKGSCDKEFQELLECFQKFRKPR